ncbi:hypothetical protein VYU27_004052 [Nannochloropsis oceanica]
MGRWCHRDCFGALKAFGQAIRPFFLTSHLFLHLVVSSLPSFSYVRFIHCHHEQRPLPTPQQKQQQYDKQLCYQHQHHRRHQRQQQQQQQQQQQRQLLPKLSV